ncbi:MAG: outer membrane protein assembly factor BamD [Elusimicrobia bacterium]|nr:outer membrane protein assembly factor BamD [Elusimicrobiota bacterium]
MKRALLALAPLLFSGCLATQRDVLDLENQADELGAQIIELKKIVSSMQGNQADLGVQFKQLHEDMSVFTETVKQSQEDMKKLSSKLDDLSVGLSNKVAAIGSTLTNQQAKSLEEQKAALASQANSPTELFNTADVRLGLKNYSLAAKGFEDYVAKFPKGALIDVATYKLGQAYYGDRKWEAAGRQFALLLEKYPKSGLIPSARLYYALSLVKMKKNLPEARQYLESIPADFPSSPEAKAAARELKKLAPPPAAPPQSAATQ